jgi:hypothetical protein
MTTFRSRARRAPFSRAFHRTRPHRRNSTTTADDYSSRLHDEISADNNDMVYAASAGRGRTARGRAFIRKWRLKCKAVADSLEEASDRLFTFTLAVARPMEELVNHQCD